MRFISLVVAFCFSFNVLASTGTIQELERSINDYQYSLSVEWDQKDQAFYETRTQEFFDKLEKLIKEDGLSQDQIMDLVEKKTNNTAVIDALKLKLHLLSKNASPKEMAQVVKESVNDLYAEGASWNGVVIAQAIGWIFVAAIVGYTIWWESNYECVEYKNEYVCQTYNNCYGANNTQCTSSYTTCGYMDVCTSYQKK